MAQAWFRRARTNLARRIGRFLGVSDLFVSVHALQRGLEVQTHEIDNLRNGLNELHSQGYQLSGRLDGLTKVVSELQLSFAVWVATIYLAQVPVPEHTLISVVLATRNRAALLGRAIDSVIAQSYSNWELIVVDDGSDDDTPEILRTFTDSRIRLVRREQGGPSAARNTGLDQARGEYVVYQDDDNVMSPHWLRGVAWAFDLHPDAEVMIGAHIIDDERRFLGLERGGWPQIPPYWFDRDAVADQNMADTMQLAHRRDLPEARFDEQLTRCEDWDLIARLARDRDPVLFPALAGIYTTTASERLTDSDWRVREAPHVKRKIAAMRASAKAT